MADYQFKVNGVQMQTEEPKPLAKMILELAKEKGAIPGNPVAYILQGEKGTYGPNDPVNLLEDNVFIAIPDKPTPVA